MILTFNGFEHNQPRKMSLYLSSLELSLFRPASPNYPTPTFNSNNIQSIVQYTMINVGLTKIATYLVDQDPAIPRIHDLKKRKKVAVVLVLLRKTTKKAKTLFGKKEGGLRGHANERSIGNNLSKGSFQSATYFTKRLFYSAGRHPTGFQLKLQS